MNKHQEIIQKTLDQAEVRKHQAESIVNESENLLAELPPFCDELLKLPHGLGHIQNYIFGSMKYPSQATAGIAAIAAFASFAMPYVTIQSYSGLGLNEYFMVLAPTSFGKEDLRKAIKKLYASVEQYAGFDREELGNLASLSLPKVQFAAPASCQALHKMIEADKNQFFMSDEFAEWLAQSKSSAHNQAALGYLMECYTSALSSVSVPQSIAGDYQIVNNPRVAIFSTSTAERMAEVMTQSHSDSGAYNRWVIYAAEQTRISKVYDGLEYEPSTEAVKALGFVLSQTGQTITFETEAWAYFKQHDSKVIEPLKFADAGLAGRLSEQAIKMAAVIALSDERLTITKLDLTVAYKIRENLYHRSKDLLRPLGAMSDEHQTGRAVGQLTELFERRQFSSASKMANHSRSFRKLSEREKRDVLNALIDGGVCLPDESRKGRYRSLLC